MAARISLNLGRTGGHRPPLQSAHFLPLGKAILRIDAARGLDGAQSVDKRCRRSHGRVERLAMDGPLVSRYLTLPPCHANRTEWFTCALTNILDSFRRRP